MTKRIGFLIQVFNRKAGFYIIVTAPDGTEFTLPWEGGEILYEGFTWSVRGPYHGLETYHIYKLEESFSVVEEVK